jgi:flagellar biosynthesis protein FliR
VQLALGLVARAAPRLQVFGLSFAVAVGVGLLTLHAAMPTAVAAIAADVRALPDAVEGILARP